MAGVEAYGGVPVDRLLRSARVVIREPYQPKGKGKAPTGHKRAQDLVDRIEQQVEELEIKLREAKLPKPVHAAVFDRVESVETLLEEIEHILAGVH